MPVGFDIMGHRRMA